MPSDERQADDCQAVRALMQQAAVRDREVGELDALRIQRHVEGCADCLRLLDGRVGEAARQDRWLRRLPTRAPSSAEWDHVAAGLAEFLDPRGPGEPEAPTVESERMAILPLSRTAPGESAGERRPRHRGLTRLAPFLPLAAGLAIAWLVIDDIIGSLDTEPAEPFAEVSELPADQSSLIQFGDADEGVLVLITSG